MPENSDDRLLDIAGVIADGDPVDWSASPAGEMSDTVRRLQVVASVAAAYRAARDAGEPESTQPVGPPKVPGAVLFTWGHLQVLERLGEGGFGEVYRAFDPVLEREVALKLRRAEPSRGLIGKRALLDEARRLARVRHPNVLAVHGADLHEGRVGLWTDLVVGQTLEERLAEDGPLSAREAALVGVELCNALAAMHVAGLTHGDVKASNVMRERGGRVVLMDFGAVTECEADQDLAGDPAVGTPLVLAPEVLRGEAPTPLADLYSLGVLLYRLVCGRYPVEAASLAELCEKHHRGEAIPLADRRSDLPASYTDAVARALAPSQDRCRSAGALRDALTASLGALGALQSTTGTITAPEQGGAGASPSVLRRSRGLLLALVVAVVLSVSGVVAVQRLLLGRSSGGAARPEAALYVDASLYRETAEAVEAVVSGSGVAPGDRLFLEVEGREPLHVYVLNEDDHGHRFVLFPLAGLDTRNPLPAGTRHRLPGRRAGVPQSWEVSSAGGTETFLVVAARQAMTELEREITSFEAADPARRPEIGVSQTDETGLRGIGGLAPASAPTVRERGLDRLAAKLAERQRTGGVWLRQLELINPGGN